VVYECVKKSVILPCDKRDWRCGHERWHATYRLAGERSFAWYYAFHDRPYFAHVEIPSTRRSKIHVVTRTYWCARICERTYAHRWRDIVSRGSNKYAQIRRRITDSSKEIGSLCKTQKRPSACCDCHAAFPLSRCVAPRRLPYCTVYGWRLPFGLRFAASERQLSILLFNVDLSEMRLFNVGVGRLDISDERWEEKKNLRSEWEREISETIKYLGFISNRAIFSDCGLNYYSSAIVRFSIRCTCIRRSVLFGELSVSFLLFCSREKKKINDASEVPIEKNRPILYSI